MDRDGVTVSAEGVTRGLVVSAEVLIDTEGVREEREITRTDTDPRDMVGEKDAREVFPDGDTVPLADREGVRELRENSWLVGVPGVGVAEWDGV